MSTSIAGKVALVTGAGRGIGRAVALQLAGAGAAVALAARTQNEIDAVAEEIASNGGKAIALPADVGDEEQVERLVRDAESALGAIDILVNNAGIARFDSIVDAQSDDWDEMIRINLKGTMLCSRAAMRSMINRKTGWIVNIASSASKKPYPNQSGYCASKFGVLGFSKVLALEAQEHGIHVSAVCPGGVDTQLVREERKDVDTSYWMKPEDIAEIVLFLVTRPEHTAIDEVVVRRFDATPM